MKKRGFGYVVPAASAAPKKLNLQQRLEAERLQRLAQVARIDVASSPLPTADNAPLPLTERDKRPLEQRMGLETGADRDAEQDRRKQATIADPNSDESRASEEYAAPVANEKGWDAIGQHMYALSLRSVTIHKERPIPVELPTPGEMKQRINTNIMGLGHGAPPEGFAWFHPGNLNAWLVLGLEPPGLQRMVSPSYSPLTQAPGQMLTAQEWMEVTRRKESFYQQAERDGYLQWVDKPTIGYLKL
jgi:hypothetical protein